MVEHVTAVDRRVRTGRQAVIERSLEGIRAQLTRYAADPDPDTELDALMLMHEQLETSMLRTGSFAG